MTPVVRQGETCSRKMGPLLRDAHAAARTSIEFHVSTADEACRRAEAISGGVRPRRARGLPCERFTAALANSTSCITWGRGGWLGLTPWGTSTSYSLPASWRTPVRVKLRTARFEHNASVGPPKLTPLHEVNRAAAAKILSSGAHAGHLSRSLSGTFGYCFASILGYNRDAARRHVNHVRASC